MFSKLSLLMAVMWCSAAEATGGHGHDVSQLCEDSARRFAADRVRAEEKVIALGEWCRKMSPEYDAAKCATAAAAVDLEALVFRTEGDVLLKECTQAAPEGEQRKAAVQNMRLDFVFPVVVDNNALFADIAAYILRIETEANLTPVDTNELLTSFNEALEYLSALLQRVQTALESMLSNL